MHMRFRSIKETREDEKENFEKCHAFMEIIMAHMR